MNLDTFDVKKARFCLRTFSPWHPESLERLKATAYAKVDELIALSRLRDSPGYTMMSRVTTQSGTRFFALVVYEDDGQGVIDFHEFIDIDDAARFARQIVTQHDGGPVPLSNPEAN